MQGFGPDLEELYAHLLVDLIYLRFLPQQLFPAPQGNRAPSPNRGDPPILNRAKAEEMAEGGNDKMVEYVGVEADDLDRPVFDLTQDLLYKVFSHLEAEGLCCVAQVCRQWGAMSGHEDFWHTLDFTKGSLSVEQIADVCRKFPKASTVFLGRTSRLDDSLLGQALGGLRNLTSLHISRFHGGLSAADGFGPALEQHCPNLTHLSLTGVMLMSAQVVVRHPKLETLVLNDSHCPALLVACPALKTLSLLQHVEVGGSLVLQCPLVETVDFSGCNKLPDGTLRTVLVTLTELRSLNVTSCALITDDTMRQVAAACAKLERLNASHCPLLTFATVRLSALLEFTATNCESVAGECVNMLGYSMYLERLTLDYCARLASLELELYYLQSVSLFNCRLLSDVKLRTPRLSALQLGPRSALRSVDIYSTELRELSLCGQAQLREVKLRGPELTSLDLTGCEGLQELAGEAFMDAEACPKLTSLVLDHCEGLLHLSLTSPSLSRLSLEGCSALHAVNLTCPSLTSLQTYGCTQLARARLAPVALADVTLGTCPHLASLCMQSGGMEVLNLKGCGALEDVDLDCPAMTELDTSYCSKLSSLSLAPMAAKCRSLSTLILAGADVSADGLLALSGLQQLTKLDLSYTEIDSLTAVFSACSQLKALLLSACKRLPDSALEPLHFGRHMPQLEDLDVSYCNFSAQAIGDLLARAPHIARLSLSGCSKVDDSIWDRLAEGPREPTEGAWGETGCPVQATGVGVDFAAELLAARGVTRSPGGLIRVPKAGPDCPVDCTELEVLVEEATGNCLGLATETFPEAMDTRIGIPIESARIGRLDGALVRCENHRESLGESPEHSWVSSMQSEGVAGSPGKVAKRLREVTLGDRKVRGGARQRTLATLDEMTSSERTTCAPPSALVLTAMGPGAALCRVTGSGPIFADVTIDTVRKNIPLGKIGKSERNSTPELVAAVSAPLADVTLPRPIGDGVNPISDGADHTSDDGAAPISDGAHPMSDGASLIGDGAPMDVEPRARRLTSLSLVGCKKLRTVQVAKGTCPALTGLNVSLCENVREAQVEGPRLTLLNLKQCVMLTRADVDCPNLRTLNVQGSKLDDDQIRNMVSGCAALETLDVRECVRMKEPDTLTWVREMCPALRRLHSDAH